MSLQDIVNDHVALRKKKLKNKNAIRNEADDVDESQYICATLPLHVKMFEKHRLRNLRSIMTELLHRELQFHCRAIEELSVVYESLSRFADEDV